jgi:hypothetical protein
MGGSQPAAPLKAMHRAGANQTRLAVLDKLPARRLAAQEEPMFNFSDLFQWERFVTPSIIKIFYWLAIGITILFGLSGMASALAMMTASVGAGFMMLLASLLGMVGGVIFARIVAEFILIVFRINEHLGAIRSRGEM